MTQTRSGGLKCRDKIYEKFGTDFYQNIGRKGGSAPTIKPKGFAAMSPEKRRACGRIGGRLSDRTGTKNGEGKRRRK